MAFYTVVEEGFYEALDKAIKGSGKSVSRFGIDLGFNRTALGTILNRKASEMKIESYDILKEAIGFEKKEVTVVEAKPEVNEETVSTDISVGKFIELFPSCPLKKADLENYIRVMSVTSGIKEPFTMDRERMMLPMPTVIWLASTLRCANYEIISEMISKTTSAVLVDEMHQKEQANQEYISKLIEEKKELQRQVYDLVERAKKFEGINTRLEEVRKAYAILESVLDIDTPVISIPETPVETEDEKRRIYCNDVRTIQTDSQKLWYEGQRNRIVNIAGAYNITKAHFTNKVFEDMKSYGHYKFDILDRQLRKRLNADPNKALNGTTLCMISMSEIAQEKFCQSFERVKNELRKKEGIA